MLLYLGKLSFQILLSTLLCEKNRYRKLRSIVTGHSSKIAHFCASKFMGNCIHGVNYDAVKNTVAVYRVYKTYLFCSFPFSQLLFTVWALYVLFSYYGRATVVLRYEMSHSVFSHSSVPTHKRLLIQQLVTSNATNNFRHRISSLASKLST